MNGFWRSILVAVRAGGAFPKIQGNAGEVATHVSGSSCSEAASVAHNPVLEKQQHKFLAPVVQWERFLPLRTIKVLLLENDDSTSQVVSALVRNCCNGVTVVANMLEAWRVLEDLTNHIDLVLTEHVWIRCHNSSGSRSGRESGIQGQNITQSDNDDVSDNNTYSDDEDNGRALTLCVEGIHQPSSFHYGNHIHALINSVFNSKFRSFLSEFQSEVELKGYISGCKVRVCLKGYNSGS
ncbi:Two-component response regulator-like PRR73 [Platanthera guangdongensis]|uniref:Two-component response regulator-like PRR73 n=1 Tax=Platanthera guangdongensis TaxID=2320717 RepID=A0ABR2LT86_9ASPA